MREQGHIRVVDDEPMICDFICEVVSDLGYSASYASEAECATAWSTEPDILFLDLGMPGADGIVLIRSLATAKYDGDIILISGFDKRILSSAEALLREHGLNAAGSLPKPIAADGLEAIIEGCRNADRAMPVHQNVVSNRAELYRALVTGEIVPFYQPKTSLTTGQVTGFEALARWQHPQHGVLPPNAFLPLIDEFDLHDYFARRIIDRVLADWRILIQDRRTCSIAVNLDASSLTDLKFPEQLEQHIRSAGVNPDALQLEVTEGKVFDENTKALDLLTRLSLRGFKLSIDGFGTGHSSLERLRKVLFSELKIDPSFVSDIHRNRESAAIVESMVRMAHSLDMKIVAEGVESMQQVDLLAEWGCCEIQGYLVAPAMDATHCRRWLDEYSMQWQSGVLDVA